MYSHNKRGALIIFIALLTVLCAQSAEAQYFGRNKVQYEKFRFKILRTPHFEIYNYMKNDTVINQFADMSERWYNRHRTVLDHRLDNKNPIMIYDNHSDFSQTTLSDENIGQGTGGVTEGYKGRVFMPFFESNAQTDHVLGHELVHAFQYDILKSADSLSLYSIQKLPLWMVEGMAEYLSLGRKDSHTAMWMRDAVVSKDFPSLKDLSTTNKYFPYRYGQAFWAYVAGVWGDSIVKPLFVNTAKFGYQMAVDSTLGYEERAVSNMWKIKSFDNYKPFMQDTIALVGQPMIRKEDVGDINISPVLSPDGKYVTFFSEKNLFSIDLFLADVETGTVIRKLSTQAEKLHVDDYNYIQDAGTWSPDGKKYAYIVMIKGKSVLVVVDVHSGKTLDEIRIRSLPYFSNPSWSPDGEQILVTAMNAGKSDLHLYDLKTKKTRQLTDDFYSEFHCSWSHDGKTIVFSSDRGSDTDLSKLQFGSNALCLLDVTTGKVQVLDVFPKAFNANGRFSKDDKHIFFLSNADGFRNLYEYSVESKTVNKLTKYFTGISGITEDAPAFSVGGENDLIAYCLFKGGHYNIYQSPAKDFPRYPTDPSKVDFTASLLPPFEIPKEDVVAANLSNPTVPKSLGGYTSVPYKAKFNLVAVSQSGVGVGVSTGGGFGSQVGASSGIGFQFGDILDRNQLFAVAQINGEIYDLGGGGFYLNRSSRINWGIGLSHTPYQVAYYGNYREENGAIVQPLYLQRTFVEELSLASYFPISQTLRWELNLNLNHYSYRVDEYATYYDSATGQYMGQSKNKLDSKTNGFAPLDMATVTAAYVGDNSQFGLTAPVKGERFRIQAGQTVGTFGFSSITVDYRKYFFHKPWTIAVRGMYTGRYGSDRSLNNLRNLSPIYIGYDQLIRGYNYNSLDQNPPVNGKGISQNQMIGDHLALANFEFRFPLTGPKKLSKIKSGILFSDIAFFTDAGMVWGKDGTVNFKWTPTPYIPASGLQGSSPLVYSPIVSTGITLRINLFGYAILEPYYAIPFQRANPRPYFGLFLSGGGW